MPWKETRLETMREEFVKRVLAHEKSKSALCHEYGISRPTGDKWIARYLSGDQLKDMSRAPKSRPNKTDPEIEKKIVEYREKYPAIGAVKMRRIMQDAKHIDLPSARTFNEIFKRNGLITKEASEAAKPYERFEKSYPNEMWQADFKGHFSMGNGVRCHTLNIIDDYSRMNICCEPLLSETFAEIKPCMERIFQEYGMPFSFLCDNGNPWGTQQSTGFTSFEVWLMELGILTMHGRILHPQTQGKEERFNGSFTRECLRHHNIRDQADAAKIFGAYRDFYNNIRPHMALGLEVPASRYTPSSRQFPARISPWEYPDEFAVRNVKSSGYITINGQGYFLSEAFGDKQIAFRESSKGAHLINLYFRQFRIGQIDIEKRVFTFKRAYLIDGDPRERARDQ
ncbi:MAG: transposase [Clostridia bacterium]|nr:transposase [Clostridia bacterium]